MPFDNVYKKIRHDNRLLINKPSYYILKKNECFSPQRISKTIIIYVY